MGAALVILASLAGVSALWLIVDALRPAEEMGAADVASPGWSRLGTVDRADRVPASQALAATAMFAAVIAVSGWILPALVVGGAGWWAVGAWCVNQRTSGTEVEQIEALASWIENLRDVLVAGDQPIGAISSTVATCPAVIRPQVRRLAAGLGRQDPDLVFRRFADEIDDPIGDLVAAGLSIAVRRGARTVGVLSALAEQARAQSDRRRLIEAERAPTRREVTMLTAIMGLLLAGLLALGRSEYLRAYDTAGGQVFLSVALAGYAALLARVQRLARFPRPARFLVSARAAT
jgi:hypothetical protein